MSATGRPWICAVLAMLLHALAIRAGPPTLEVCAARVLENPGKLESYMCYWFVARAGDPDGAIRALEAHLAVDPANHGARLYLAAIHGDLGHEIAQDLYREAADGFAGMGEATGEVYARLSRVYLLLRAERGDDADRELDLAEGVADAAQDPVLQARVWMFRGSRLMRRAAHAEALGYLYRAERVAFPDGPVDLRAGILSHMAEAYQAQGLLERARETFGRAADVMRRAGDAHEESVARLNVANLARDLVARGRMRADQVIEDLLLAVETSRRVGNPLGEAWAHLLLARFEEGPAAIEHAEIALRIYSSIGHHRSVRKAMRDLALLLWTTPGRRVEAARMLDEAISSARDSGDLEDVARGHIRRAQLLTETGEREGWIEASLAAVDAVERIRHLQPGGVVGARLFSGWTTAYYRFSGALLRGLAESPDPAGDLELAFRTVERMRTRLILDEMDGARALPRTRDAVPQARRRAEVLEEIARIQKRLADPGLDAGRRVEDLENLERLETEEALLREAVARGDPVFAAWHAPSIPTLDDVRRRLAPDQAVLSFQLAPARSPGAEPAFRGGAWVIAITRQGARAFPLPDRDDLRERIGVFLGLFRRRDGTEERAGTWLYRDLLAEPLHWMGPGARRLVLIPDDCLHGLPFAALRPRADEQPLGVTHRLGRAPSATFWMRWDPAEAREARGVLALADPELPGISGIDRTRSARAWLEGLRLGGLPRARREARTFVRLLGGRSRVAAGAAASEHLLKEADLASYGILHLAAHAIVDDENPDRSAVVLAPGDEREDGFLQVREIVDLDVGDTVVILSTCRSASGSVLQGGALLGLGQGFLQAGARAVIGNLWPMRDEDAEPFVRELGRMLARGESLAGALAGARAARLAAGDPAAAWAGMVVLGDGDFVPVPGGRRAGFVSSVAPWIAVVAIALLLACTGVIRRRRHAPARGRQANR